MNEEYLKGLLEFLSWYFLAETEGNHNKPQLWQAIF
jgi:hypothetical protein